MNTVNKCNDYYYYYCYYYSYYYYFYYYYELPFNIYINDIAEFIFRIFYFLKLSPISNEPTGNFCFLLFYSSYSL